MKRLTALILTALMATFILNCGGGGGTVSDSGSTKVTVNIGQSRLASFMNDLIGKSSSAIPSNVASVIITISGPGMNDMVTPIDVAGKSEISATFDVPNGPERHFLAVAVDGGGKSLFQGGTTPTDLNGTPVNLTIQMGFDVSGEWTFSSPGPNGPLGAVFITFSQTGNSITFSGIDSQGHVLTGSGSITGNSIQLQWIVTGLFCGDFAVNASGTGTVSADASTIDISFTQSGGCPDNPPPPSGTLSGVRGHIVPQLDVTGAWSLLHTQQTPQTGLQEGPDFFNLTQAGNTLTFTFIRGDGSVHTGSGSISGNSIQLSFPNTDECDNPATVNLIGTISDDGNTMNGNYAVGTGSCEATGTWSATKAQPPAFDTSGSWSGFHTQQGGTEQGPDCFTVTQTGSSLIFFGDITGSGILSGSNIMLQFGEPAGPSCEIATHLTGTVAPDGNTASGTYTTSNDCGLPAESGTWRAVKGVCTPIVSQGTVSGTVTDQLGQALAGVDVALSQQDIIRATGATDSNGRYSLTAPAGSGYSIAFSKAGYIPSSLSNITVTANTTTELNPVALSPVLAAGQVRIILTWGANPSDLDSHLTGPILDSSQRFEVYFGADCFPANTCSFDNASNRIPGPNTLAVLDHDDTSSFGPETTTIVQQIGGVYRFFVHAFSCDMPNGVPPCDLALSNSGARVQVYLGSNPPVTYDVPTNQAGRVWSVFELNGTTLTTINTISPDQTVIQSASQKAFLKKTGKKR